MANVATYSIPDHLAIVMDGNRRWAKERGDSLNNGHKAGFENFKKIVDECFSRGIKTVTVYAFSSENWNRTEDEVGALFKLMMFAIKNEIKAYKDRDIKVKIIGDVSKLPKDLQKEILNLESQTINNNGHTLNVAISYGGRAEIVRAANLAAQKSQPITEQAITDNLYTASQSDPSLIIRTGGSPRLSNFLTWQSIYSEIYFTKTLWPDFSSEELETALEFYNNTKRNFGR